MKHGKGSNFVSLIFVIMLLVACSVQTNGNSTVQPSRESYTKTATSTKSPIPSAKPTITIKPTTTPTSTQIILSATLAPGIDQYQIETLFPGQYLVGESYGPYLDFFTPEGIVYEYFLRNDIFPSISPDLRKVAFTNGNHLGIMDLQDRSITQVPNSIGCKFPNWAPDGMRLVAMCNYAIEVISLESGDRTSITNWSKIVEKYWYFPSWSPDGQWIAYLSRPSSPHKTDPENGIYVTNTACLADSTLCESMTKGPFREVVHPPIDWSPDSKYLAVATSHSIATMDMETGALQHIVEGDFSPMNIAWSPDGEWIAFDIYSHDVAKVSLQDSELITVVQYPPSIEIIDWIVIPHPFAPGDFYTITESGADLNFRAEPTLTAAILRKLQPGDTVTIVDGPVEADGYTWWQMQADDGMVGWAVNIPEWYAPMGEE